MSETVYEHAGVPATEFGLDGRMDAENLNRELKGSVGQEVVYGIRTGEDGVARYAGKVVKADGAYAIDFLPQVRYDEFPGLAPRPNQRVPIPVPDYEYTGIMLAATYMIVQYKMAVDRACRNAERVEALSERVEFLSDRLQQARLAPDDDDLVPMAGGPPLGPRLQTAALDPAAYPQIGRDEALLTRMETVLDRRYPDLRDSKGRPQVKDNLALDYGRTNLVNYARLAPYVRMNATSSEVFGQIVREQIMWLENITQLSRNTITSFGANHRRAVVRGLGDPEWIQTTNTLTANASSLRSKLRGKKGDTNEEL